MPTPTPTPTPAPAPAPALRAVPVPDHERPDPDERGRNPLGDTVAYVYEGADHVGDICDIRGLGRSRRDGEAYEGHFWCADDDEWESWRGESVARVLEMMRDAG